MLWDQYVFRRGNAAHELWDDILKDRPVNLLYIAGRGFDVRAQAVMREFVAGQTGTRRQTTSAKLLLLDFQGYELDESIIQLTEENAAALESLFMPLGETATITIATSAGEEASASDILRQRVKAVLAEIDGKTDIILDVSSLPRATYLALLTNILQKLVPNKSIVEGKQHPLYANGVNFQVLVAEDAGLDGKIRAEDPSNDLVKIPGFTSAWEAESLQDRPLVWFPVLGENRVNQLQKIIDSALIPGEAEVCPVVPHPSKDPRRADNLLVEYRRPLFDAHKTSTSNIIYAHESHPFEAYRQLLNAMRRYQNSMEVMGGCRLVMTPLGSKLITIGAGLACFEMRSTHWNARYHVAIPHAEPKRYLASVDELRQSTPEISVLVLTGGAYGIRTEDEAPSDLSAVDQP